MMFAEIKPSRNTTPRVPFTPPPPGTWSFYKRSDSFMVNLCRKQHCSRLISEEIVRLIEPTWPLSLKGDESALQDVNMMTAEEEEEDEGAFRTIGCGRFLPSHPVSACFKARHIINLFNLAAVVTVRAADRCLENSSSSDEAAEAPPPD